MDRGPGEELVEALVGGLQAFAAGRGRSRKAKGRLGGRPPAFDREAYKRRNAVERTIGRLKRFRGIATRYDKLAVHYEATIHVAIILDWQP